jgi:hypothetical protein
MSGGSGYVLTGLKVKSSFGDGALSELVTGNKATTNKTTQQEEQTEPNKKQKTGQQ